MMTRFILSDGLNCSYRNAGTFNFESLPQASDFDYSDETFGPEMEEPHQMAQQLNFG